MYADHESHNAQRNRHRQTDGLQDDANSRSYCVAVRWAKKFNTATSARALCSNTLTTKYAKYSAMTI